MSRNGPGRPRKFPDASDGSDKKSPPSDTLAPTWRVPLQGTPEGVAIKAFRDVLDSGCLQVNAVLPVELSRALRHLYMQIDHLINQGVKSEREWHCMSYGAQIAANKVRVEKWKADQAKAQEEMARQQHLSQQQVMQQMGLPAHNHPQYQQMTPVEAQNAHAIELERMRSAQHPYPSQQPFNPMQVGRHLFALS